MPYDPVFTSLADVITAAVSDFAEHGYDSEHRLEVWLAAIRSAAMRELLPEHEAEDRLREALRAIYLRLVDRGGVLKRHPGVERFTLERVKPKLRAELDRRILASANLIKLNRQNAIAMTLQRFSGWATSIPTGGSESVERNAVKANMRKPLRSLSFIDRRVNIDQGHKFIANLSEILAADSGALAVRWNSHWRQAGYDYREDHKERDGRVYAMRDSWAMQRGLMKRGDNPYYDEITGFAEEVNCRCYGTWLHSLGRLPSDMLTNKGRDELALVKKEMVA